MDLTKNIGFFIDYYMKIKNECTEEDISALGLLNSDIERIEYVSQLAPVRSNLLTIQRKFGKCEEKSLEMKQNANDAFRNKNWMDALMLYSKSYVTMPSEKESDISIILANRSAALFHLQKFDEALSDISRSINLGYPKELCYKLHERSAQCYLAKKIYKKASEAFKKTITALDDSKLTIDKRAQIEKNAIIMIKLLEKENKTKKQSDNKCIEVTPSEFITDSIAIDSNEEEGRHAKALKDIQIGEDILRENSYVFALLQKYCKTHCQHCFKRTIIPVACPQCIDVIFCSELCQQKAINGYHKYECGILSTIWESGASLNCHLSLRIAASKDAKYFVNNYDSFFSVLTLEELKSVDPDDYRKVHNLVRHDDKRSASSFLQYSLMALFLNKCLIETNYFFEEKPIKAQNLIAAIILRNLQIAQFNTHEIFELHTSKSDVTSKTVFIGGGIYPTLALFNHSCDPGITKYFKGTMVNVQAIKPIMSGDIVAENYGPIFTQEPREERRSKMKELYWFDCNCLACKNNWPQYEEMTNDVIRFKCDSEQICNNVLEIPVTCNDFMIKCVACGQHTNILKGLKVMQDSEIMKKTANRFYQAGEIKKSLEKYIDVLKIMSEVLCPPFTDYCQCQQNIKDCFLHFGNSYCIN